MPTTSQTSNANAQARRLETAVEQITAFVYQPENAERLRAAPGENEWNVLETLGHCNEMIPFWLGQCLILSQASETEPPPFGRTLEDPGRLAGVERGAKGDPDALVAQLQDETRKGAARIRALTPEERAKRGIHPRRGAMTVEEIVENFVVAHAEEHQKQIQEALQ